MTTNAHQIPPLMGIVGYSGSGKTTLLEKIIRHLTTEGLRVATLKHTHHDIDLDQSGKDTWRHKQAGAVTTLIATPHQVGMVQDLTSDPTPATLASLAWGADLLLVEGFKHHPHPKIEIFRPTATDQKSPLCLDDPHIVAVVSEVSLEIPQPCFGLDDIDAICGFIRMYLSLRTIDRPVT